MRIAYGYKRREADFDDLSVDRVWIDGEKTERQERQAMLRDGLRRGDTLVLLSRGDLGVGKIIAPIEAEIERLGATVEIREPIRSRSRPGPKPEWEPTPEQDERLLRLWKDVTADGSYVLRLACEGAGMKPTPANKKLMRSRLNRRYGVRSK